MTSIPLLTCYITGCKIESHASFTKLLVHNSMLSVTGLYNSRLPWLISHVISPTMTGWLFAAQYGGARLLIRTLCLGGVAAQFSFR